MVAADLVTPSSQAEALLGRYIDTLAAERNLSPYTLRNYRSDLGHLFVYLSDRGIDPLAMARLVFRGYLAALMAGGMAQRSITRRVSTARSFFRWLRLNDVVADDPLANVRGPKQAQLLPRVLTAADISALIEAADAPTPSGLRDRALLEVMYACGIRVSECVH